MRNLKHRLDSLRSTLVKGRALFAILLAPQLLLLPAGCTVTTGRPAVVAEEEVVVQTVPTNIDVYPQTRYRGDVVYYVDGRWYHRRGRNWSYYRREPAALTRHRRYVEQAPPAPRYRGPVPHEAQRVH